MTKRLDGIWRKNNPSDNSDIGNENPNSLFCRGRCERRNIFRHSECPTSKNPDPENGGPNPDGDN